MTLSLPCVTHLDLKGAPPNVDFLASRFIPFLKKYGSWGVLLEWEDTFPFTSDLIGIGSLGGCSRDGLYSVNDVKNILQCIKNYEMEAIQLVQTIGHMEYVLKHGQYRRLREVPNSPAVLCPSRSESRTLVQNMICQVMDMQPDAKFIHIGADEAWHINVCSDCQEKSLTSQYGTIALYLEHIKAICTFIKTKNPNIKILMWDDMIREVPVEVMNAYDLGDLVQPVVWNYNVKEGFRFDKQMWERYFFVFPNIWAASAFKGANSSSQIHCCVQKYVNNQIAWNNEITIYDGEIKFAGIILTGWSRFDHYATMCELLPLAMPCLATCLQMWGREDGFTNENVIIADLPEEEWPGFGLACAVNMFGGLREHCVMYLDGDVVTTWLNPWQVAHDYTNPLQVERIARKAQILLKELQSMRVKLTAKLSEYTGRRSTSEFVQTFLVPVEQRMQQLQITADARMNVPSGVTPKSDKCLPTD